MKSKCFRRANTASLAMAILGLILVLWPATGQGQRSSRRRSSEPAEAADPNAVVQGNSWASFDIILKRNIFSRQRTRPRTRQEVEETRAVAVPNPESYYLLKGVVQENDDFIAFIEDTQGGTVLRLRRGDPVARGTIKSLTLDGLEYQREDKTMVVRIGLDLEGGQGNATAVRVPSAPASSAPAAASATTSPPAQSRPATPSSGAEADVIKRLMEQRKQQLGQ